MRKPGFSGLAERLVFTGLEADRIDHLTGSMPPDTELQKFGKIAPTAKQAELDCIGSHDAVEPVTKKSVTGSSGPRGGLFPGKRLIALRAPFREIKE